MTTLSKNFLDYTKYELSMAVGPIAPFIFEEAINDLGHKEDHIPVDAAEMLIDMISSEIPREEKKAIFRTTIKTMMAEKYAVPEASG